MAILAVLLQVPWVVAMPCCTRGVLSVQKPRLVAVLSLQSERPLQKKLLCEEHNQRHPLGSPCIVLFPQQMKMCLLHHKGGHCQVRGLIGQNQHQQDPGADFPQFPMVCIWLLSFLLSSSPPPPSLPSFCLLLSFLLSLHSFLLSAFFFLHFSCLTALLLFS